MKQITPMKRLSTQFKKINTLTKPFFKQYCLNESKSKDIPYPFAPRTKDGYKTHTKGVLSEYISNYEDIKSDISFAFSFEYKNKKIEECIMFFSIKLNRDNKSIIHSKPMNFEELKNKISLLIKNFPDNPTCSNDILKTFSSIFLQEEFDLNEAFKIADKKIKDALKDVEAEIDVCDIEFKDAKLDVINNTYFIKKEIEESDEHKELLLINKKIAFLENVIKEKKNNLNKKFKLEEKKNNLYTVEIKKQKLNIKKNNILNDLKSTYPKAVAKKLFN